MCLKGRLSAGLSAGAGAGAGATFIAVCLPPPVHLAPLTPSLTVFAFALLAWCAHQFCPREVPPSSSGWGRQGSQWNYILLFRPLWLLSPPLPLLLPLQLLLLLRLRLLLRCVRRPNQIINGDGILNHPRGGDEPAKLLPWRHSRHAARDMSPVIGTCWGGIFSIRLV